VDAGDDHGVDLADVEAAVVVRVVWRGAQLGERDV
jgi:hypothetical protein